MGRRKKGLKGSTQNKANRKAVHVGGGTLSSQVLKYAEVS
jgi:hypothetical protein